MSSSGGGVDMELLLDRLLSASTPTDALDSLDALQSLCRRRRPAPKRDPKTLRPSEAEALNEAQREAEDREEERQAGAVEGLLGNGEVLNALCALVSSSTLPASSGGGGSGGMEVEGGDVAACELLLLALPSPPSSGAAASTGTSSAAGGATTEALQKQRRQRRRTERISKTLLHFHEDDDGKGGMDGGAKLALTPSLLDCLCASTPSVYARVLSLQTLQSLLSASPGALREQLMTAPDGINRLVDLLGHGSAMDGGASAEAPEEVRNQALLFLTSLASSSSVLARLITFSEGYDRALKIALEAAAAGGSGLSSSSTVAMDCLDLCLALAHADEVARELFLGGGDGRGNLDRLARLSDLRGGERFRDKERNVWWENELRERRKKSGGGKGVVRVSSAASIGEEEKKPAKRKGGRRGKRQEEDDLDDILRGASTTSTAAASKKTDEARPDASRQSEPAEPEGPPTPYLTPNETKIVDSVLALLLVLLRDGEEDGAAFAARSSTDQSRAKRRGRAKTIVSHESLARYIVDCALYTLPPPGVDYVSAVPPPKLQQKALVAMAALGSLGDTIVSEDAKGDRKSDSEKEAALRKEAEEESKIQTQLLFETFPIYLYGRVAAIDRLMFLCCTGAYTPKPAAEADDTLDDDERPEAVASLLSTYSISAFRSCLPADTASRMVLHALAPPPPEETDESGMPAEPSVITRLATTLADNLRFLQSQQQQHHGDGPQAPTTDDVFRATIGASGAAGALGVFLTGGEGDATREMLLRLPVPPPHLPPSPTAGGSGNAAGSSETSANLIDFILHHVSTYDPDAAFGQSSPALNEKLQSSAAYVTVTLLRLLSEWVIEMPRAVMEVLSSPSSVALGVLLRSKKRAASADAVVAVPALSGLLLGLCLEYMSDSDGSANGGNGRSSARSGETSNMDDVVMDGSTIMNMIQSMGVGKYLNMVDEYKKRPLPLPYCVGAERSSIERSAFAAWYGRNVTVVRRRVVTMLAGHQGEDEDESDAEGAAGGDSSVRSLRKMVTSQARDMEELQARLEEALSTIATQSVQMKELKRVAEAGTSAETNDMISEYTEKLAELEKAKAGLKKEAEHQSKLHQEAIRAKDDEVKAVQEELRACQASVEEMRRDNETLSEEMSGLSAAYNALELQYHDNNNSSHDATAAGETAAEDGGMASPGGEAAAEDPGRDAQREVVQSLQDENARLREDVRAANEWMSMAVSKMEEMGGENEALARSLEEAQSVARASSESKDESSAMVQSMRGEIDALRKDVFAAREEAEAARASSATEAEAKDEELAREKAVVRQLEERVEEMKLSSSKKEDSSASSQQLQELESLRQANTEAQEWMASAVAHVDMLTKQVAEKDQQLEQMANKNQAAGEAAMTPPSVESEAKISGLEKSLSDITSERDHLKESLAKANEEMTVLQEANRDLHKTANDSRAQDSSEKKALQTELDQMRAENSTLKDSCARDSSEKGALQTELDRVKAENAALNDSHAQDSYEKEAFQTELDQISVENERLTSNLADFQSWSETAQARLAEVEAALGEATAEKDGLKMQLDKALEGNKSSSHDLEKIASLEKQIREKNNQLEQMQNQLIEDAEEHEADNAKLLNDLQAEKQRAEDLMRRESKASATAEALTLEKDLLSSALTEKQAEIDLANAGKNDADSRVKEANRRISELEAAKMSAEAQVDKLTVFQDEGKEQLGGQIAMITAERNELRSELDDMTEEYEETRRSLEHMSMENGNLMARTRALEQDNKSLEYQYTEAEGKMKETNNLLVVANDDKSTLQEALEVMKIESEETVQLWQERTKSLEDDMKSLKTQLEQQEKEASEAIALWEARCSTLEESDEGVIKQWEERVQSLEANIASLENQLEVQEKEAADVIAQWESRCSTLEESGRDVVKQWEERVQSLGDNVASLENQLEAQEKEAAEAIALWETTCSTLRENGQDSIRQWEERVHSLEDDVASLEEQLVQKEKEATEAIEQWEARCSTLEENGEGSIRQWEERVHSLEGEMASLDEQLVKKEKEATEAIEQWAARCSQLEESLRATKDEVETISNQNQSMECNLTKLQVEIEEHAQAAMNMRAKIEEKDAALASSDEEVSELAKELVETQNQAKEAISLWEARCTTLSEERVQLDANIAELNDVIQEQESLANEAIAQWEARCSTLNDKIEELELQLVANENDTTVAELTAEVKSLMADLESSKTNNEKTQKHLGEAKDLLALQECKWEEKEASFTSTIDQLKLQLKEKDNALAISDEQASELAKEMQETQNQATEAISLWEERCSALSEERVQLEDAIKEQESGANEAISQWETRCATLNERIEELELQIASNDKDIAIAELKAEMKSLTVKLEANKIDKEKTQQHLKETKDLLALRISEWEEKKASFSSTIGALEGRCSEQQKKFDEEQSLLDSLKDKCTVLEDENKNLQQERKDALKESEESQAIVLELKEELRNAKEELQSFATDQFTVKATEMATQALRQQMVEIRSQYAVDHEVLTNEREGRQVAEEEVERLKSDLALLAQATEYNEDVDVYVRKMAKKVSAENVKAERKEMEELRSTLERLREELGSCRWNNHESQEKAANARLQMSILEQEVNAAKIDLQLIQEAMEELENSKMEMSVSLEYRIESLENERLVAEQSYEEDINGIKAELALANQERDNLAHKLEQSEKANAALVYSTSHDGLGGEESESEMIKLQLERAQLLANINEMGADLERRVREAVAAQASSSEAELIVEKRSRKSVETSLTDVMSELEEVKKQLAEQAVINKNGELADKEQLVQDMKESLDDMRTANDDLAAKSKLLQANLDSSDKENKSTIEDLTNKLQKAEERLRSMERESRFEAALASEIANLRANAPASANGNQKQSHALVLRGIDQNMPPNALSEDGKDFIDRNSAYIIEMYDYVVDLKNSITEERQLYRDLMAEHEELLALLGQTGFNVCE